MKISPDILFERDNLKKQIMKWKWLFIAAILVTLLLIPNRKEIDKPLKDYIARIKIEGVIQDDDELIKMIRDTTTNKHVAGVIIYIDSPGGGAYAGENLFIEIKKLSNAKPVVSVMGSMATSGGYMVALATDHIIARNMTLTGSIGVIWQSFEIVDLANKLGINFLSFKSSPLKAAPNPLEKVTPNVAAVTMDTINDTYEVFLNMLMKERSMSREEALKLADGRVYTGLRAKSLNLIDEIGGEDEAEEWLKNVKKVNKDAKIVNVRWQKPESLFDELTQFFQNSNKAFENFLINNKTLLK